ncbi:unnamed protein product, partial [marine sediment metagenome]
SKARRGGLRSMVEEELVDYLKKNINSLADELLDISGVREFLEEDMKEVKDGWDKLTKKRGEGAEVNG